MYFGKKEELIDRISIGTTTIEKTYRNALISKRLEINDLITSFVYLSVSDHAKATVR